MNTSKDISQSVSKPTPPKAYRSPKLTEYGSIQQLTKSAGPNGMGDGGGGGSSMNMTGV